MKEVVNIIKYMTYGLLWGSVLYGSCSYLTGLYPLNEGYGWGIFGLVALSMYVSERTSINEK